MYFNLLQGFYPAKCLLAPKSQSRYERIILMKYVCADIGTVKMTVGVFKKTHKKEQYCITVIEADIEDAFKASEKHKNNKTKSRPRKGKTKKPQKQKNEPAKKPAR